MSVSQSSTNIQPTPKLRPSLLQSQLSSSTIHAFNRPNRSCSVASRTSQRSISQDYSDEARDVVELDDDYEWLLRSNFIPDACFFSPTIRPDSVGQIAEDTKFSLSKLLEQRMPKNQFEDKFGAVDAHRPYVLATTPTNSTGDARSKLSALLTNRPSKQRLSSLGIIKGEGDVSAAGKLQSTQQRLLQEQRKNKLNSLLNQRSSIQELQKQNILPDDSTQHDRQSRRSSAKLVLDGLFSGNRPTPETLLKQRIITDIGDLPSMSSSDPATKLISPRKDDDQITLNPVDRLHSQHIVQVACGFAHTLARSADGKLHVFGAATNGRLGIGEDANHYNSADIILNQILAEIGAVTCVASGDAHSAAIVNGHVYTWGAGSWGRLGVGHVEDVLTPTRVRLDERIVAVKCGAYHTLVLTEKGQVCAFGWHKNGRCGVGKAYSTITIQSPALISTLSNVIAIDAGQNSSMALTSDGRVYTFGSGIAGVLGHGDEADVWEPKLVESLSNQRVTHIACGAAHSVAITADGQVLTCGSNKQSELGRCVNKPANTFAAIPNFTVAQARLVTCGKSHTLLIDGVGQLYSWGSGNRGVCATGQHTDVKQPSKVTEGLENRKVFTAAASWAHSVVVTEDGAVLTCGSRNDGKLGY